MIGVEEDVLGLTPLQQGMLFHEELAPEQVYVVQSTCELVGPLDVETYRACWQRVIARHAVLRSAFPRRGGEAVQVVFRAAEPAWHLEDWRPLSPEAQGAALDRFLRAD